MGTKSKKKKNLSELIAENESLRRSLANRRAEDRARKKLIAEGYKNTGSS